MTEINTMEFDLTNLLNKQEYIYYLHYKNKIIYIGRTVFLEVRIGSHLLNKPIDKVTYKKVVSDPVFEELKEILTYYPILNRDGILEEDYLKPECEMSFELGDYIFSRNEGVFLKTGELFNKPNGKRVGSILTYKALREYRDRIHPPNDQ